MDGRALYIQAIESVIVCIYTKLGHQAPTYKLLYVHVIQSVCGPRHLPSQKVPHDPVHLLRLVLLQPVTGIVYDLSLEGGMDVLLHFRDHCSLQKRVLLPPQQQCGHENILGFHREESIETQATL